MKPERWQQIDKLFHAALECEREERAVFLDQSCAGEETLRKQVEALLAAHEEACSFIESPAMEVEARSVADGQNELTAGQIIGRYRILSQLGVGGMGEVYLAEDATLGRKLALKLLPSEFTSNPDRLRRFQQEARAASALNHPNIVTIHEIGQVDNRHFIATEFIDGQTLRQRISAGPPHAAGPGSGNSGARPPLPEVLNIAIQTADALSAAHEAGIVHRDIKPENVMVRRRDGYVKVLDFGLAKLTESAVDTEAPTRAHINTSAGVVMGTPSYMSPEQARGEAVDARTDLWSLGVVLYELVAGCVPFERTTPTEIIASILEREPPPLARYARNVPSEVERIVDKTLTKDREERYQTARDLLVDLRRIKQRLEVEAEIERTAQSERISREETAAVTNNEATAAATARVAAVKTGDAAVAHSTSSVANVVKQIIQRKRAALLILLALVAATASVAYLAYSRDWVKRGGANINPAISIRSVAVLPFANESNDADAEYLSDGIAESLIDSLSQLPGVKVIARSSSFKYKGKEVDPHEVARALGGVDAILTGRVLQRGDSLLIRVELVDARDNTQTWGEQYNRRATDVLAVQVEISRTIAEKLRLHLTAGEQRQLTKGEHVNPQAYELLNKGRFYWRTRDFENGKKVVGYFQQAIAVDPTYALAYAELAAVYEYLYSAGLLDQKEFAPKAEAAARKALELDDGLAEAHVALANVMRSRWDWAAAEHEYKRAIDLNPNLAAARSNYAFYLMSMRRDDEAIAEAKRTRELDPLFFGRDTGVGYALFVARRYDDAIESLKQTLEMDQSVAHAHFLLGFSYVNLGRYTEGIAEYHEAIKLSKESSTSQIYLGAAYAKAGQRQKAQEILKQLQTSTEYVSPAELVALYAALGEREQAFASLEKAYAAHDLQLGYLGSDPSFDSLREDPRFKDLMRRVGLTL